CPRGTLQLPAPSEEARQVESAPSSRAAPPPACSRSGAVRTSRAKKPPASAAASRSRRKLDSARRRTFSFQVAAPTPICLPPIRGSVGPPSFSPRSCKLRQPRLCPCTALLLLGARQTPAASLDRLAE